MTTNYFHKITETKYVSSDMWWWCQSIGNICLFCWLLLLFRLLIAWHCRFESRFVHFCHNSIICLNRQEMSCHSNLMNSYQIDQKRSLKPWSWARPRPCSRKQRSNVWMPCSAANREELIRCRVNVRFQFKPATIQLRQSDAACGMINGCFVGHDMAASANFQCIHSNSTIVSRTWGAGIDGENTCSLLWCATPTSDPDARPRHVPRGPDARARRANPTLNLLHLIVI